MVTARGWPGVGADLWAGMYHEEEVEYPGRETCSPPSTSFGPGKGVRQSLLLCCLPTPFALPSSPTSPFSSLLSPFASPPFPSFSALLSPSFSSLLLSYFYIFLFLPILCFYFSLLPHFFSFLSLLPQLPFLHLQYFLPSSPSPTFSSLPLPPSSPPLSSFPLPSPILSLPSTLFLSLPSPPFPPPPFLYWGAMSPSPDTAPALGSLISVLIILRRKGGGGEQDSRQVLRSIFVVIYIFGLLTFNFRI